jgi:predicted dehydrogenase
MKTTIGMLGCGSWGSNWVRTLASIPDVELRWCCDLSDSLLAKVRQQYPSVKTTSDPADVFADPQVEGVVLATIAKTHHDLARRALEANKHVMVEKPMTLVATEAVDLEMLAGERHRVLMVGHLLEYHPALAHIKRMIDTGDLGDLQYVYCQRLNLGKVRGDENAWWSLAPHDISVVLRLLGTEPLSVQCRGQEIVQQGVADVVFATLEFPDRKLAHIHVSWLDPNKTRKITVVGSKKMVVFDDGAAANKVAVHDKSFRVNLAAKVGAPDWVTLTNGAITHPTLDAAEPLKLEAQHFVDCIRNRQRPISHGESGALNVAVLEYGQQSLEQGRTIAIPTFDFQRRLSRKAG